MEAIIFILALVGGGFILAAIHAAGRQQGFELGKLTAAQEIGRILDLPHEHPDRIDLMVTINNSKGAKPTVEAV